MTFLYATGFWAALALFIYVAITEEDKSNADSNLPTSYYALVITRSQDFV